MLFSGPKYLSEHVAALPDRPAGFADAAAAVLAKPGVDTSTHLMELMTDFTDWPWKPTDSLSAFVNDNELAWLHRALPPEYS